MRIWIIILTIIVCSNVSADEKNTLKNNDKTTNLHAQNNEYLNHTLTFLLLVINTLLFINTYKTNKRQAKEMKEALDINRKTFIASQRPWVAMKEIKVRGNFDIRNAISLSYVIKNAGNSPASNIIWNSVVHLPHMKKVNDYMEELINEKNRSINSYLENKTGFFLSPGEEIELNASFKYELEEYEKALKVTEPYNYLIMLIIGHISYKFDIDNSLHESRFVYQVRHKDYFHILPSQGPISMDKIEIKPFGAGFTAT